MSDLKEAGVEEIFTATAAATAKIRDLRDREGLQEKALRVRVVGGGCHGFSYALGFDEAKENDTMLQMDGVDFVVDRFSTPYLMGASIDFVDGLNGAGFKISNPNAKSTCGCGESFTA